MRKIIFLILLIFTNIFAQKSSDELVFDLERSQAVRLFAWKYQIGDSPHYSNIEYDDSDWSTMGEEFSTKEIDCIWWYRKHIFLKGDQNEFDFLTLRILYPATAYEIYWDGMIIHREGTVAESKSDEIPGLMNRLITLRSDLTKPGNHVLAIRLSNHHNIISQYRCSLQYLSYFNTIMNRNLYLHLFSIGMFLFAVIFSLALFFSGGKNRSYLIFTLFALFNMMHSLIRYIELTMSVNMVYADFIYQYHSISVPLSLVALNIFFIFNYEIKQKIIHVVMNMFLALIIHIFLPFSFISFLLIYSIGIILYAFKNKEPGSMILLLGITTYTVLYILYFFGIRELFLYADILIILSISLSISRQIRAQNKLYEISRIRSARLETELLKKNIRPHFLMNTLLSIISWIEMNPKKSMKLIQALADEFRMIDEISSKKRIPISEEIKLCKIHLELMSYRMDATYRLETHNLYDDEDIPPMIFHTLIENGLTHAYQTGEDGLFTLSCEKNGNQIHYQFINGGSLLKKNSYVLQNKIEEGMGIKYIKARLNENYPNRWKLQYGLIEDKWVTDIYIEK